MFFVMLIIMCWRYVAYFVGRRFGKMKTRARDQSGKDRRRRRCLPYWSASCCGLIAAAYLFSNVSSVEALALSVALAIFGQIGDLFESWIKRAFAVKDSGELSCPGHGGVLDRLDSLIFPAVFTTTYLRVLSLMRTIALLGSTGSIGVSTLALVREFPERFRFTAWWPGRNLKLLAQQIKEFRPRCVVASSSEERCAQLLRKLLGRQG